MIPMTLCCFADEIRRGLVILGRHFSSSAGGAVDVRAAERRKLLYALLPGIDQGRAPGIRNPEVANNPCTGNDRQAKIRYHTTRGGEIFGLQKLVEQDIGQLNVLDPCARPALERFSKSRSTRRVLVNAQ